MLSTASKGSYNNTFHITRAPALEMKKISKINIKFGHDDGKNQADTAMLAAVPGDQQFVHLGFFPNGEETNFVNCFQSSKTPRTTISR